MRCGGIQETHLASSLPSMMPDTRSAYVDDTAAIHTASDILRGDVAQKLRAL